MSEVLFIDVKELPATFDLITGTHSCLRTFWCKHTYWPMTPAKGGQLNSDFGVYPGIKTQRGLRFYCFLQQAGADPNPRKGARMFRRSGLWVGGSVTSVDGEVSSSPHAASSTAGQQERKPEWKVMFVHS